MKMYAKMTELDPIEGVCQWCPHGSANELYRTVMDELKCHLFFENGINNVQ